MVIDMAPKLSVVVPVYNVENYLSKCLDSILKQTLEDIEIICVNDGSTDGSANILQDYKKKDPRIIVLEQENQGLGAARNTGIRTARGEYIGFVDSDDFIEPTMYEKLYEKACKFQLDIVLSLFLQFFLLIHLNIVNDYNTFYFQACFQLNLLFQH